jgi:hypothetical protein
MPNNAEAVKQMTTYIQQCPSYQKMSFANGISYPPLSTAAQLLDLMVVDTRRIDKTTVEVVFQAKYKAIMDFETDYMGQAASVLPAGRFKKGNELSVTGITSRFQAYDQRGWVLVRVGPG